MNDEDSANDSDSVDSIAEAKAEFPVNMLVESSGTATNPSDSVVLSAEGSGFPSKWFSAYVAASIDSIEI
jgi:hypothetical protein